MNDVDRIFEIIGDEDYDDRTIISFGLVIEFDENGNVKSWGFGE